MFHVSIASISLFLHSSVERILMFLRWENLVTGFAKSNPLNQPFSGEISEPGLYAILGPNGCGKSTLMRTWIGLMNPLSGTSQIEHCNCKHSRNDTPCLGYVPQFHRVNPHFSITVRDLVRQGLGRTVDGEGLARVEKLLLEWDIMGDAGRPFHELSMGQKTRALVARALVSQPKLIFMDEPLASLDAHCQNVLINALKDLVNRTQICVLIIDHHLEHHSDLLDGYFIFQREHYLDVCTIAFSRDRGTPIHTEGSDLEC